MDKKQLEASLTESNEMVLIESRTMRDQHVYRDSVLEKVKVIPSLPNTVEITTEMASSYYEVPVDTIRTIIKRNRDEFNEYGEMRVLKGKILDSFKSDVQDELLFKGVKALTLINRRGLLRLGMLLTESEVAKSIRNYLLNVEEVSDKQQRQWAVEREISKRERRLLTDSIQQYEGASMKGHEYSNFTNLVYNVLFDCNATQLKKIYELDKDDPSLRDSLTTEDLRRVVGVERVISSLIKVGKDYGEIKDTLLGRKDKF